MKKKNILYGIILVAAIIFACGCEDNNTDRIVMDTVEDGMHLTVSQEEIVLSQDRMDEVALKFTWGEAQPRANNGVITYYFKLGLPDFTTAIDKIEMEDGVFEYSYNQYDLNILLYSKFGVPYGSTVQLEAEIIADSDGDYFVMPEISTIKFMVTTFEVAPVNLYLVGSANPAGSATEKGIKLTEIVEGRDIGNKYKWEGELQAGSFTFVNSLTEDNGSWSMGNSEAQLVENVSASSSDIGFTVEKAGWYSIILNKNEKSITHGYKGLKKLWGVGLGIGIAWSMPSGAAFDWDPANPHIFTLNCTTQANNDFKLPYNDQGAGWSCPFLRPYADGTNIWVDNRVLVAPAGYNPDSKWLITEEQAGNCILTIDTYHETISLVKR